MGSKDDYLGFQPMRSWANNVSHFSNDNWSIDEESKPNLRGGFWRAHPFDYRIFITNPQWSDSFDHLDQLQSAKSSFQDFEPTWN